MQTFFSIQLNCDKDIVTKKKVQFVNAALLGHAWLVTPTGRMSAIFKI
jgi:hypothetical protein